MNIRHKSGYRSIVFEKFEHCTVLYICIATVLSNGHRHNTFIRGLYGLEMRCEKTSLSIRAYVWFRGMLVSYGRRVDKGVIFSRRLATLRRKRREYNIMKTNVAEAPARSENQGAHPRGQKSSYNSTIRGNTNGIYSLKPWKSSLELVNGGFLFFSFFFLGGGGRYECKRRG